jgi:hypothetical protein
MFDKGLWFLLPDLDVIERMEDHRVSGRNPGSPHQPIADVRTVFLLIATMLLILLQIFRSDESFQYRVVPAPEMKGVVIYYQHHDSPSPDANPPHYTPLYYPYTALPIICLHVHPYFAALDAGRKLNALGRYRDVAESIAFMFDGNSHAAYSSLLLCERFYTSWTGTKPPPDFTRDQRPSSRAPPDPDNDSLSKNLHKEGEKLQKLRRSKRNKGSKRSHVSGSGAAGQKDEMAAETPRTRRCAHTPELEDDRSEPTSQHSSDCDSGGSGSEYEGPLIHQWDIPAWIERNLKTVAKSGGWEMSVVNDDQLDDGVLMPDRTS